MIKEISSYASFLDALRTIPGITNSFISYEYYQVLCNRLKNYEGKFICFEFERDGQIIGLFPLIRTRLHYVQLGYRYSNYLGYICPKEEVGSFDSELKVFIKNNHPGAVIVYYDINDSDDMFKILETVEIAVKIPLYNCPYCSLGIPFDDLFKRQITKSKKRTEIKKFGRKLEEIGTVEVINIDNETSWNRYHGLFSEIFIVHQKRFHDTYIPDNLCLYKNQEYYTALFENLVKVNRALISIMTLDGHVISFVYTLVSDGVIQDWMPAFNPTFSKYNLGTVHLMKLLEFATSNGYRVFDFSKGDGVYKDRWSDGLTKNYMFVRNFDSSLRSITIKNVIVKMFATKTWMRRKGYLGKIKHLIAWSRHKDTKEKDNIARVYYTDNTDAYDWILFSYDSILQFSDHIQELLLESYYTNRFSKYYVDNNNVYIYKEEEEDNQ